MAKRKKPEADRTPNTGECESCKKTVPAYEITHLSEQNPLRSTPLCGPCFFETMGAHCGTDFDHATLQPITVSDASGQPHVFHFRHSVCPVGLTLEAFEIKKGNPGGYEFQVLGDFEADPLALFTKLYERIKRELARTHLRKDATGTYVKDMEVRAQITWDDEEDGEVPTVVIDGQEISWRQFGKMMMCFEGWKFKLEIFDKSEER